MSHYEYCSKDELIYKIHSLENRLEQANEENRQLSIELDSANFRIREELEPRIARERRSYDNYMTNPERHREY